MKRKRKGSFWAGCFLAGLAILFVGTGIFYTPYDPNQMNAALKNTAPCWTHWFGTDNFGRDILSRVMAGSRTTFLIALCTVGIGTFFGIILGAITGYFGGILDKIIMRMNDVLLAFPSLLLSLVFISIIGIGKYNSIAALGIAFIPSFVRVVRSEFVTQKEMDYVKNARIMGAGHGRIMFVHILPNTFSIVASAITIGFNNAVLAEAGMSYLGLGVQPPDASLGRMLSESQAYLFSAPWYAVAPGMVIIITVLGFSLVNEKR
ncbi:ABC transporter permease [Anaeromicropila populeti]|uniref:Peptide/nickel transport system permease protein n=1 Tax=Anaeromicropila populeti TaxID=37658 RepID=A0A1I6HU89_9FIRM|nr:ABC transporter permease [Anaeromicropila populeti]SFR58025.1 peptide/nickel transport system permease protein [Anaeromicropila populeti]